jgi:UPF0271 protein
VAVVLNIDAGELLDEPEELYAIADVVSIACGGHAGDAASMRRVLDLCKVHGTSAGAHPSYVDREGFGRRAQPIAPDALRGQVADQCEQLFAQAQAACVPIEYLKPHGALYHAADADEAIARAVIAGAIEVLGYEITCIGPANGELAKAADRAGIRFAREAFADRAVLPSGKLVPRDQPGAVIHDPRVAAARALELARSRDVDTLCVHGDTPGSVAIARAVRDAIARATAKS